MSNLVDLSNKRFGRLIVLRRGSNIKNSTQWFCRCDCGAEKMVRSDCLKNGDVKSCGCLKTDLTVKRSTKHGHAGNGNKRSKTYYIWARMIQKCTNENDTHWKYYGGRGICFDPRWESFETFLSDMGEKPGGFSLERIDVNGNYEKSNCKWIPRFHQAFNRRNTLRVKINGKEMPASHAAKILNVPRRTFTSHVHKFGAEEAVAKALKRHFIR